MRVSIPLTGDLAIIQGETYQALTLTFPGDLTTWTPRGQIRTGLLEDAGTLLAEFAFGTPAYDADADTTAIYPTLTATQTANLPKTKYQGTGEYSRSAVYYYDVELESNDVVIKSKTAIVQVVGEVTGSGTPAPSALETFLIASNNLSEITDPEEAQNNLFPDGIPGGLPPDLSDYATITALNEGLETKQPIGDYLESDDIANFETTTQLNDRDTANRSRSNHTGTQTASTISDFDTEVSNNTDVAANTSARHDAVTVVDSSEIDFTLTGQQLTASIIPESIDESKLDASVNASLDLADSSVQLTGDQSIAGTKTFTTALILPNNSRVNGVEHFYQTTKPTARGDASALVAGDRWWKTDDGTEWFWNGTYWVSANAFIFPTVNGDITSVNGNFAVCPVPDENWLCDLAELQFFQLGGGGTQNWDASNYWTIRLDIVARDFSVASATLLVADTTLNYSFLQTTTPVVRLGSGKALTLRILISAKTGDPVNGRAYGIASLRKLYV